MTLIELYILNNHVDTYLRLGRIDFIIYLYIQNECNAILTLTVFKQVSIWTRKYPAYLECTKMLID